MILGWTPFLDPIHGLQDWWYLLLLPFVVGISMIYKALKVRDLDRFWRHVAVMSTQIVVGMIALGVVLAVLMEVVIPLLPVQRP